MSASRAASPRCAVGRSPADESPLSSSADNIKCRRRPAPGTALNGIAGEYAPFNHRIATGIDAASAAEGRRIRSKHAVGNPTGSRIVRRQAYRGTGGVDEIVDAGPAIVKAAAVDPYVSRAKPQRSSSRFSFAHPHPVPSEDAVLDLDLEPHRVRGIHDRDGSASRM